MFVMYRLSVLTSKLTAAPRDVVPA